MKTELWVKHSNYDTLHYGDFGVKVNGNHRRQSAIVNMLAIKLSAYQNSKYVSSSDGILAQYVHALCRDNKHFSGIEWMTTSCLFSLAYVVSPGRVRAYKPVKTHISIHILADENWFPIITLCQAHTLFNPYILTCTLKYHCGIRGETRWYPEGVILPC